MNIYAEYGYPVVLVTHKAGYAADQEKVKTNLTLGAVYIAKATDVNNSYTDIELCEFPGLWFNSVFFEDLWESSGTEELKHLESILDGHVPQMWRDEKRLVIAARKQHLANVQAQFFASEVGRASDLVSASSVNAIFGEALKWQDHLLELLAAPVVSAPPEAAPPAQPESLRQLVKEGVEQGLAAFELRHQRNLASGLEAMVGNSSR